MREKIFNAQNSFEHNKNIYRLAEELKIQERKIIDFSASINPLGVSKKVKTEIRKHLKYLHNYPDPEAKRLRRYIAQYHGVNPETVLCGNGSTELIYLIPRALKPKNVLMPAPTFSEYERAVLINFGSRVTGNGSGTLENRVQIDYLNLKEKDGFEIKPDEFIRSMDGCNMAFLCNPNNPTGLLLKKDSVVKIAEAAKRLECYLIVDEAFIDFCPGDTVINEAQNNPYLIVLRSMTNFYALSGLRIGYGVFSQHLIAKLKDYKEPQTVNSLAQRAAVIALKDKVYRKETSRLMAEEKRFLENGLKKLGIDFFHSDVNFYLLKMNNANAICQHLGEKGILVKNCSNFRGLDATYIRVAVKSHRENTILIKELTAILQS